LLPQHLSLGGRRDTGPFVELEACDDLEARRGQNARLRPIPDTDCFELFYWSNTKGRWTTFGNLRRMKLMLESAREIIENDPMFRVVRCC
jgi:hypothetical protein